MHDSPHRLNHSDWISGLENVASHINAACALIDGFIGHGQRIQLGQLLAAGKYNRHRTC